MSTAIRQQDYASAMLASMAQIVEGKTVPVIAQILLKRQLVIVFRTILFRSAVAMKWSTEAESIAVSCFV